MIRDVIKLHGIPDQIVSDRDPIFMSEFWRELFKLKGIMLATCSAYHPQMDGQTEVLSHCLEDYLRCFTADNSQQWSRYLPLAEWHYNTSWHSTIRMTPFEVMFVRSLPSLTDQYLTGPSSVASVDELLAERAIILQDLKENLNWAQQRIRN